MLYHVAWQVLSLYIPHKSLRLRPNGSMDRNVRRLDSTRNSIHVEVPQPAVAEAQGNLKNCRYDPKSERYFTFWKCKENRKGDHLRVAKPEGPPYNPLLGHA